MTKSNGTVQKKMASPTNDLSGKFNPWVFTASLWGLAIAMAFVQVLSFIERFPRLENFILDKIRH